MKKDRKRISGDFTDVDKHVRIDIGGPSKKLAQKDEWIIEGVQKKLGGDEWRKRLEMEIEASKLRMTSSNADMFDVFNKAINHGKANKFIDGLGQIEFEEKDYDEFVAYLTKRKFDATKILFYEMALFEFENKDLMIMCDFLQEGEIKKAWFKLDDIEFLSQFLASAPNEEIGISSVGQFEDVDILDKSYIFQKTVGFLYVPDGAKEVADRYLKIKKIKDPRK